MGPHHRNSVLMGRNTKKPPSFPFSSSLPPFLSFSTHACMCMRAHTHTHTRPCEDTRRRNPSINQEESPYQEPNLPELWEIHFCRVSPMSQYFVAAAWMDWDNLCFLEVSWLHPSFLQCPPTSWLPIPMPPPAAESSQTLVPSVSDTDGIARGPHWQWQQQKQDLGHIDPALEWLCIS